MFLTSFLRVRSLTRPPLFQHESVSERSVPDLFLSVASCLQEGHQSLPLILRRRGGSRSPQSGAAHSPRGYVGSGSYCPKPLSCYKPLRCRSCLKPPQQQLLLRSCVQVETAEMQSDVFPAQSFLSLPHSPGSQGTLLDSDTQSQKGSDISPHLRCRHCRV